MTNALNLSLEEYLEYESGYVKYLVEEYQKLIEKIELKFNREGV